jgi:hypothetical protein
MLQSDGIRLSRRSSGEKKCLTLRKLGFAYGPRLRDGLAVAIVVIAISHQANATTITANLPNLVTDTGWQFREDAFDSECGFQRFPGETLDHVHSFRVLNSAKDSTVSRRRSRCFRG